MQTFWRSDFKCSGFQMVGLQLILLLQSWPFKIRTFLSGFQMLFDKWQPFVQISNGWASGFQIPSKIRTICNPTSFWPFDIQTSPNFIFLLHLDESGFGASSIQIPTVFNEFDFRFFGHSMFEQRGETSTESCFLFYGPGHKIHRATAGNGVTFYKKRSVR